MAEDTRAELRELTHAVEAMTAEVLGLRGAVTSVEKRLRSIELCVGAYANEAALVTTALGAVDRSLLVSAAAVNRVYGDTPSLQRAVNFDEKTPVRSASPSTTAAARPSLPPPRHTKLTGERHGQRRTKTSGADL